MAARARWEAAGIANYRYDLAWSCFCNRPEAPVKIVVHSGELVSATYSSGATATPSTGYDFIAVYGTIDRVFEQIDAELQAGNRFFLEADFDGTVGFPMKIYSDSWAATDSGMSVTITNFEMLP